MPISDSIHMYASTMHPTQTNIACIVYSEEPGMVRICIKGKVMMDEDITSDFENSGYNPMSNCLAGFLRSFKVSFSFRGNYGYSTLILRT